MEFKELQKEMIAAMKSGDKVRKNSISNLIAAIKKVAIDEGKREEIPSELVERVILKELKSAKEQIDTCPDSRADLKEEYTTNYNIISEFAPKQLGEDEIKALLEDKFKEVIATKNKGMIMKEVMKELKGKADGALISKVVADLCK